MTIPEAFAIALQHHQAGRLGEAEALYRQILAVEPRHADAWHLHGVIASQVGRNDFAVDLIRRAIALAPDTSVFHSNLGEAYRKLGRLDEAIATHGRAIQLQPDDPWAHSNLGMTLRNLGRLDEAIAAYRRAIQLQPDLAEAHSHLGNALREKSHLDEAIAAYRRAIQLKPGYAEAHSNLGNALREKSHLDEAIAACHRAIQLQPDLAEAHSNLGAALMEQGHLTEAAAAFQRAIQLQPGCMEAHTNLGAALAVQGRFDEAIAACRRAIQFQPDSTDALFYIAFLLLVQGDFEHGWPLFENRWEMDESKQSKRNFPQPMWKGEALAGQRVLLRAEQGFGDTLQFIRYAPLVAARGGKVMIECQPGLRTLLTGLESVSQIIERGEPLPPFDLHCPLMSLPLAFGTRLETIPAAIPYLRADAQKAARWRERLDQAADSTGERNPSPPRPRMIGLVWAGGERPHQPGLRPLDQRRSMHLSQFAPLAEVPGVVFVSLQKGGPAAEAKTPPAGMRLLDWTDELEDFADTAALVECLDLVICVDTAVAHLAGAMGKPIWLLNRFDTCWRWLLEREDSPWYPTMRLFRQPRFLDWEPVMARVREELVLLATTPVGK